MQYKIFQAALCVFSHNIELRCVFLFFLSSKLSNYVRQFVLVSENNF